LNIQDRQLKFGNILLSLHSISKTINRQSVLKLFYTHNLEHESIRSFIIEKICRKINDNAKQEEINQTQNKQMSLNPTLPPINPFFNFEYLKTINSNGFNRGINFMNILKKDFNTFKNYNALTDCISNEMK
jgi:hypothetical protein